MVLALAWNLACSRAVGCASRTVGERFGRGARAQHVGAALEQELFAIRGDLLRRSCRRRPDHFGGALADSAMVVDMGEAEVGVVQAFEGAHGLVLGDSAILQSGDERVELAWTHVGLLITGARDSSRSRSCGVLRTWAEGLRFCLRASTITDVSNRARPHGAPSIRSCFSCVSDVDARSARAGTGCRPSLVRRTRV